jgi:hypothetical protein
MTHPLFLLTAQLNNFRRLYPALQLGSHANKWNDSDSPGLFAYTRRLADGAGTTQEVFVVFNTSTTTQTLTNRTTSLAAGTQIVNLFNTNEILTIQAGPVTPPITVSGTSAKIFVAQSDWKPLDPVVSSNSPAHDATSIPTYTPIVLQFSKPMDTNSVQSAFSTAPAVSGTFSWSGAHDVLTFTAGGSGLPALTTLIVKITNSAVDAVSGKAMYAPYQMQFRTTTTSETIPPTLSIQTPASNAVIAGNFQISGVASDNVAVQKVEIKLDGGIWTAATGINPWLLSLNSSNFLNGPHIISARAKDTSGNISVTNSVGVRFINVPGNYLQRISGGNPANVTDCSANVWLRDTNYTLGAFGYSGGSTGFVANAITGICAGAQTLYQRERFSTNSGGFSYQFDCPAGIYEITLLEAETYWNAAGKRQFNIFIQGRQVLTNFDIFANAGAMNLPLTLVFTNSVTNSQLQILFTPVVDNARVSGLQVRKIADVFSDTDGISDWWRLAYFGHALGALGDNSRGGDDADGDGVSNLTEFLAGTGPLNPASFPTPPIFNITQIVMTATNLQLSCLTTANWSYQLQLRASFDPSVSWTNSGATQLGTGGTIFFDDSSPATNNARFYRVQAR